MAAEIVAPITEPETEWVRGRLLQKVSSSLVRSVVRAGERLTHARLPGFELDVTALFATVAPP